MVALLDVETVARGGAHVSLVNDMLRDLDSRKESMRLEPGIDGQAVRPSLSDEAHDRHEAFWRVVAGLMLLALIAVGWIAYSLRPRPSLATELAYRAAAEGRLREGKVGVQAGGVPAVTEAAAQPAPAPAREERTQVPSAPPPAQSPVASLPGAAIVSLSLRLARSLDNPPAYAEDGTSAAKPGARSGVPPAALEAQLRSELARAGQGESGEAQLNQLLGAVLQRLSRHEEAVSAYRAALEAAPQKGSSWIGMGMSLEALGRKQEALDAYRRGVGSGSLDHEQQVFAQQRILVLR